MSDNRKIRLEPPGKHLDYEVGYGKPPVASRFEPGHSGNPRGRPKGARNRMPAFNEERLKAIILEEAYRTIKVSEGQRQVTIPWSRRSSAPLPSTPREGSCARSYCLQS